MPTNRRILSQDAAVAAATDSAQGLVLHLDANDEDSIESGGANTGAGSGTWFDIANHDLNVPLVDKASNLILNLDGGIYSSGAWQDQTTNGNNAALNGNAAYNSDVRGYFTLDGTGDYLQISDNSSLNLAGGGATYEIWFRQHVLAASEHLFGRYETGGNFDFFISTGSSGAISLHFYDGGSSVGNIDSGGSKYTANTWHHVAVTLSSGSTGGTIKLYIDGTLEGSTTLSGNRVADATADLFLGRLGSGNAFELDGDIGTTRIYNVALTASEVAQNFRAGNFLSYSSIYDTNLEMNLDAANYTSGSTFTDSSGNGNNGTISSTPSFDKELGNHLNFSQGQTSGASTMSTNRLTVSSFAALRTRTNFAIEIWLKSSTASSDGMIWNVFDGGSGTKFSLSWNISKFRWAVHNASGTFQSSQDVFTTNTFSTNTWLHIVATYNNGTEQKIYVNGIEEGAASSPNAGTNTTTTVQMRWGDRSDGYAVDTQIGQARFYSAALTSAQVAQNYLATKSDYPNGTNATIDGATFSATTPAFFELDGSNDFIDTNFSNNKMEEFTISAFVRFADATPSGNKYFISDTSNGNEFTATFHLGMTQVTGNWILFIGDGSSTQNGSSNVVATGISDNTWTHIVFTCDGINDTVKYYKNGSLSSTIFDGTASYIGSHSGAGTMKLGRFGGLSSFFTDMDFGQFKIFNKTLSASEVLAEYNANKSTYGL